MEINEILEEEKVYLLGKCKEPAVCLKDYRRFEEGIAFVYKGKKGIIVVYPEITDLKEAVVMFEKNRCYWVYPHEEESKKEHSKLLKIINDAGIAND
jgi:hypothetical protein